MFMILFRSCLELSGDAKRYSAMMQDVRIGLPEPQANGVAGLRKVVTRTAADQNPLLEYAASTSKPRDFKVRGQKVAILSGRL